MSIEDMFVTTDTDADGNTVRFDLIEDEDGSRFWGYGHVEPERFVAEVNRWIVHTMGEDECIYSDPDELAQAGVKVEHLWARYDDGDQERFEIVDLHGTEYDAGSFPVTRLYL